MRKGLTGIFTFMILLPLAAAADSTIKTRNTAMGHSSESTVYIKGSRQRSESAGMGQGPSFVTIMQCDQKRMITLNPQNNTCMIAPLGGDGGADAAPAAAAGASRKGGTITFTVDTLDTGERQKMFGLNARHMKSTMNAESSADACSKTSLHSESDGWYADIAPGLACWTGMTPPPARPGRAGCQDTLRYKHTGAGHPGYPLKQTTTMQVQGRSFTTESEVVELTSNPLDAAMFEMPAGCQVVGSYQELLGMGGMPGGVARGGQPAPAPEAAAPPAPEASAQPAAPPAAAAPPAPAAAVVAPKGEGVIRVGVVRINDATGTNLPLDNLRVNLMSEVTARQMEAVPLDAAGQAAIAAEAADKQCDYILYTEASQVAEPGSSIPLPAALRGVQLSKDKYQALLAVTLYRVGKPVPELKQTPLAADADQFGVNAVMAGFEKEADKIADQVKKDTSKPARTTAPGKKPAPPKKPG